MHPSVPGCCRFTSVCVWIYNAADTVFRANQDIPKARHCLYLLTYITGKRQALDNILIGFDSRAHKKRSFTVYKVELTISYLLQLLSSSLLISLLGCPISLWQHRESFDTPASLPHH